MHPGVVRTSYTLLVRIAGVPPQWGCPAVRDIPIQGESGREITSTEVFPVDESAFDTLRAFACVALEDEFRVNDIRLHVAQGRARVTMPHEDTGQEARETVQPASGELRDRMARSVLAAHDELVPEERRISPD